MTVSQKMKGISMPKMSIQHLLSLTLLGLFLLPAPVHAREMDTSVKELREEYKTDVQNLREEKKASIGAIRQTYRSERAKMHGDRITEHFAEYEKRLNEIAAKIETRIAKMKTDGKDVTSAQTQLTKAKETIALAVTQGKDAVQLFSTIQIVVWDTQKTEVKAAVEKAQLARESFVRAKKQLTDVVQTLQRTI